MTTMTVKNIPDDLYERLKAAAKAHHRSMNSEILYCVERVLTPQKVDVDEHIAAARALRANTAAHPITEEEINAAKNTGRP